MSGLESGSGDRTASDSGVSAVTLLALASAYQTAQFRLSRNAEVASVRLWRQQRPLTDADLASWMQSWDALLAGQAQQQAALTAAYNRTSMSVFGTSLPSTPVEPFPTGVEDWLVSEQGKAAPASLKEAAQRAANAIESGVGTPVDAATVDRVQWLHSPVVKQRWRLSEGIDFDTALTEGDGFVESSVYNAGRAVERSAMGTAQWPSFKNGTAMVYKRVPQAGACGWCRLVATRLYSLASFKAGSAWHAACRCSWAPVTLTEATAYSDALSKDGDYFDAASQIGLWTGEAPKDYTVIQRERATTSGGTSGPRTTGATGTRTPAQPTYTVPPAVEAQAVALVNQGTEVYNRARAAAAAGDFVTARALYAEAATFTSQAYRLRTNR